MTTMDFEHAGRAMLRALRAVAFVAVWAAFLLVSWGAFCFLLLWVWLASGWF